MYEYLCMCICEGYWRGCVYVYMCMLIYVCLFVCLFVVLDRSVMTTFDPGLKCPQGPFSTHIGRLGPFFIKVGIADSRRKIERGYQHKVGETVKEDLMKGLCTRLCT